MTESNDKSAESASATAADPFESGRERLRQTIKWLITSFGAIGASLALGGLVSNIGHLHGWRLALAIVSAAVAFAGIVLAMWLAVRVQVGAYISFGKLAESGREEGGLVAFFEQENPQYLGPYESIAGLRNAYLKAFRSGSHEEQASLAARIKNLVNVASYERLRRSFNASLSPIIGSIALVGMATIIFAWAANPQEPKEEEATAAAAVAERPTPVTVSLTPTGVKLLSDELGEACKATNLPALAVAAEDNEVEVITLPTRTCTSERFTVSPDLGVVTGLAPVCTLKTQVQQNKKEIVIDCGGIAPG